MDRIDALSPEAKEEIHRHDLELRNQAAERLNAEVEDLLTYQAPIE